MPKKRNPRRHPYKMSWWWPPPGGEELRWEENAPPGPRMLRVYRRTTGEEKYTRLTRSR